MTTTGTQERSPSSPRSWKEKIETVRDWQIALILTIVCVVSRALALPASFWEWDDILFARALHKFDIPSHSPHPPGFPVFVFLARGVNLFVHNDHLALASLSLLFACTLAAGLFYLFRAIFTDRSIAIAGSVMTIFAPAIWVHSGAARSDEPALAAGIICAAAILHGRVSARALVIGSALFGIGMGIRVTLLPLIGPLLTLIYLIRLRRGEWKLVLQCVLVGVACGASWYAPMVLHTGWQTYREVLHQHSSYWFATDAFFSPGENSNLPRRLSRFFIDVWGSPWIALTVYTLSGIGLGQLVAQRSWKTIGWTLLAFVPFLLFTTLLNTPMSAPLYGLGYMPLFTGLTAAGLVLTARRLTDAKETQPGQKALSYTGIACATIAAIAAAIWAYPAIKLLRGNTSPPVQAMQYIRQHLNPQQDLILYNGYYTPHVSYYLPDFKVEQWSSDQFKLPPANLLNPATSTDHTFAVGQTFVPAPVIAHFAWRSGPGRDRLKTLSLGRYFDAKISDLTQAHALYYTSGWYPPEANGVSRWRWMSRSGTLAFANTESLVTVRIRGSLPFIPSEPGHTTLTFSLNGEEIDRLTSMDGQVDRTLAIPSNSNKGWSSLRIETDRSIVPKESGSGTDTRDLGFQCTGVTLNTGVTLKAEPTKHNGLVNEKEFVADGWYDLENGQPRPWRWAQPRATLKLPAISSDAQLTLMMRVPEGNDGTRPPVTVTVAGRVVDTFQPIAGVFSKNYRLEGKPINGLASELVLSVPKAATIPGDSRSLAMCVYNVSWTPLGDEE